MKKFYSFLFAAVALVGFAACNSDSTEDQPAPAGAEKLSFKANIDTTKTDLEGLQTIWCKGDVVMIEGFEFVCGDDLALFTCTQPGCTSLLNKEVEAVYSNKKDGKIDSEAGVHGALLKATGTLTTESATFEFAVQNAFLKLTTTGTVTLKGAGLFSTGDELTVNAGAHYVAINPVEAKLSALSYGATIKAKTLVFEAKKIYNLGELAPLAKSPWKTTGTDGNWPEAGNVQLYTLGDFAVAYNVNITNNGFKFTKGSWSTAVGSWSQESNDAYDFSEGGWYGGKTSDSKNIIMKNFTKGYYDIFFCTKDNNYLVLPSSLNSAPNQLSLIGVVNGSNWDTDYDFEKEGDKYILKNVQINGEFKIRREHIWSESWGNLSGVGSSNGNLKLNENGTYDIELTVATSNGHIYPTAITATKK